MYRYWQWSLECLHRMTVANVQYDHHGVAFVGCYYIIRRSNTRHSFASQSSAALLPRINAVLRITSWWRKQTDLCCAPPARRREKQLVSVKIMMEVVAAETA